MLNVEKMTHEVGAWLTANVGPARVLRYEIMTGGFSRAMARVDVEWGDRTTETFVLRGDPPAELATLESDRDQEWALLCDLNRGSGLSVPKGRWYVDDPKHFGSKALIIEHIPSRSLQAVLDDGLDQRAATDQLIAVMGQIASVTPDKVPSLACPTDWTSYIDEKIAGWQRIADDHVEAVPIVQYLTSWMDANRPKPLPFRLVHGDMQQANIIVETGGDRAGAWYVIDWEFTRIGDPREDLGYYNAYAGAVPPNLFATDLERCLERYRSLTGFDEEAVNPKTFAWFTILSTMTAVAGLHEGAAAFAKGERRGTSVAFNSILVTIGYRNFLDAINAMEMS